MYKYVAGAIGVVVALVVIIGLFALHGYSTPSDMVAIRVGAGPFEAKKVKGDCIAPSTRGYLTNDNYEYFPTSEREWDATGHPGGSYLLEARATDATGYTQTSLVAGVAPNGASGYPQVTVNLQAS